MPLTMMSLGLVFVVFCAVCLSGIVARSDPPKVTFVQTIAGSPVGTTMFGFADGNGTSARFNGPTGIAVDPSTGIVYVSDYFNCAIRAIHTNFSVTTVAGSPPSLGTNCSFLDDSEGTNARFHSPRDLVVVGDVLCVADSGNSRIRAVEIRGNYAVTTIAGQSTPGAAEGIGTLARLSQPSGIDYHAATDSLLVADILNSHLWSIALSTKAVTTIAGTNGTLGFADGIGTDARFNYLYGVAVDPNSGLAITADENNYALRLVDVSSCRVTTLAGSDPPTTSSGYTDGNGTSARFFQPLGVVYDWNTNGFVVLDFGNHALRWVSLTGNVTTIAGSPPPTTASGHVDGDATTARFRSPYFMAVHPTRDGLYVVGDTWNNAVRYVQFATNRSTELPLSASPTSHRSESSTLHPSLSSTPSASKSDFSASSTLSLTRTPRVEVISHSESKDSTASKTTATLTADSTESASPSDSEIVETDSQSATATAFPSQSCEPPLVEWHAFRYDAINVSTDYLTVALQPSATSFTAVGVSAGAVWTTLALPLATLQRGSPFALNLTSAAGVSLRSASVVHSGGASVPLVASELVPQNSNATPPRFRLLKLSLSPSAKWVERGTAAVTMSLVFGGCDNRTATTATIFVGLLPVPLSEQIPIVSSVVGSTTAVVSMTTATTAARVGAVRTLLLCTTTGASTGGLLGLSIARPDVDGDDHEVLPSARGAVVGNVVAVCVVGAVLCVVCCVYSARCGVSLRASALRLALPSSLLPVLVAVLPSTMGAVVYLSGSSSKGGGGDVAVLAVFGALLCAVPLGLLAWIAFVLPSRLGLVVKPGKREIEIASSGLLGTLRWLHRSLSAEQWVWEPKESSATADKVTPPLVAPERAGRIVLIEHRLLWFSVLDVALVAFIAGLGVGSAFGGPSTCRASLIVVVVLLALETALCAALKPFTTLRSRVTVVLTLGCTTVSAVLQLVAATTNNEDALLASAVMDLAVLGMAITRMVLFDAPEMMLAAWKALREMVAGRCLGTMDNATVTLGKTILDSNALGVLPHTANEAALRDDADDLLGGVDLAELPRERRELNSAVFLNCEEHRVPTIPCSGLDLELDQPKVSFDDVDWSKL